MEGHGDATGIGDWEQQNSQLLALLRPGPGAAYALPEVVSGIIGSAPR